MVVSVSYAEVRLRCGGSSDVIHSEEAAWTRCPGDRYLGRFQGMYRAELNFARWMQTWFFRRRCFEAAMLKKIDYSKQR